MEYVSLYVYRIPKKHKSEFLQIQKEAAKIYKDSGAIDDITFEGSELDPKYGCKGFLEVFQVNDDEILFFSMSRFKNKQEHDEIMKKVNSDTKIEKLFNSISQILDIKRIFRGEFERSV